jgi:hypothetical protein
MRSAGADTLKGTRGADVLAGGSGTPDRSAAAMARTRS